MSFLRIALVALLLTGTVRATGPEAGTAASSATTTRARIEALERRSWVAWQANDAAFFSQFLSDDHVDVGPRGITARADVIGGVASMICRVEAYALGDFRFTPVAPDTAMLVYRAEQTTKCGAFTVPSPTWVTSIYAERGGRWVNVLFHQTPVEKRE